jgi:hypothetical protein
MPLFVCAGKKKKNRKKGVFLYERLCFFLDFCIIKGFLFYCVKMRFYNGFLAGFFGLVFILNYRLLVSRNSRFSVVDIGVSVLFWRFLMVFCGVLN